MIKSILIAIVFLAAVFLISVYYKTSSIKLDDNRVILNIKNKYVALGYSLKDKEGLSFSNINISQTKLKIDENNIFFEVATADSLYEFNGNIDFIVKKIFETKEINKIFSINGLSAMEIILQNNKVVNLFVEDGNMKEVKFFYGLPTKTFVDAVEKLQGIKVELLYQKNIELLNSKITHWSVKHNDIDGVVQSIDY